MTEPALRADTLPSLTGLRWGAAFVVFLYHIHNFGYIGGGAGHVLGMLVGAGTAGVSFFFVLSGFVLAWSSSESDTARRFWHRRFARIYPLHLATALIALALAATVLPSLAPSGPGELLANLLLVSSWNPQWWQAVNPVSWSLVCEAFFYLLFPLLIRMLRPLAARGLRIVLVGCLAAVLILPLVAPLTPPHLLYAWPLARLPEFLIGVTAGLVVRQGHWKGPGVAASWCLAVSGFLIAPYATPNFTHAAFTIIGVTALVPAMALAALRGSPSVWASGWLVTLGEVSYAFYLVHLLVIRLVDELWLPDPLAGPFADPLVGTVVAAVVFTVALAAAVALHRGVEVPLRRLIVSGWGGVRLRPRSPHARFRTQE